MSALGGESQECLMMRLSPRQPLLFPHFDTPDLTHGLESHYPVQHCRQQEQNSVNHRSGWDSKSLKLPVKHQQAEITAIELLALTVVQ